VSLDESRRVSLRSPHPSSICRGARRRARIPVATFGNAPAGHAARGSADVFSDALAARRSNSRHAGRRARDVTRLFTEAGSVYDESQRAAKYQQALQALLDDVGVMGMYTLNPDAIYRKQFVGEPGNYYIFDWNASHLA
jgi:hypothetical protein